MKLVTFDEGRVGRLDGETVVELDVPSTREYFERGGNVAETGATFPLADVTLRAPDRAEEVLPHGGQLRGPSQGARSR